MQEIEYKCYTNKGSWNFYAQNSYDAMRKALWFCWRDGEEFERVECKSCGTHLVLQISTINLNTLESFTL